VRVIEGLRLSEMPLQTPPDLLVELMVVAAVVVLAVMQRLCADGQRPCWYWSVSAVNADAVLILSDRASHSDRLAPWAGYVMADRCRGFIMGQIGASGRSNMRATR